MNTEPRTYCVTPKSHTCMTSKCKLSMVNPMTEKRGHKKFKPWFPLASKKCNSAGNSNWSSWCTSFTDPASKSLDPIGRCNLSYPLGKHKPVGELENTCYTTRVPISNKSTTNHLQSGDVTSCASDYAKHGCGDRWPRKCELARPTVAQTVLAVFACTNV